MQSKEAKAKFKEADELFRSKQYPDALAVLDDLDREFPDVKNILYPRAMCLARVGRYDEALEICRQLKVEFGDPRGDKLMTKISALRKALVEKERQKNEPKAAGAPVPPPNVFTLDSSPPPTQTKNHEFSPVFNPNQPAAGGPERLGPAQDALDLGDGSPIIDMAGLDDLFAAKPAPPPVAQRPQPPSRKGLYVAIGVAAAVVVALVAFALAAGKSGNKPAAPSASPADGPATPVAEAPATPEGKPLQWHSDYDEAESASINTGAPILYFFYSSSAPSPDVEQLDKYVWGEPSIQNIAKDWVCARIDVDTNPKVKDAFELTRLPTTVLMDYSEGDSLVRKEGAFSAQDFYKEVSEYGLVSTPVEVPQMPPIALIAMPLLFALATFSPVFLTLMFTGRLPEEEWMTALLTMFLIGIVAPFLGRFIMRATYHLSYAETMLYYGLYVGHMIAFFLIMSGIVGMPFHIFVMAHMYKG